MLRELKIENLAIIKELDLEFGSGLNMLTGETGAGKSIILDGINLLIGEKVSLDMIRSDADQLMAEGVFEISDDTEEALREIGIEVEDREVIVRRELDRGGKGKAYLNGKRVPVATLREVMESVVDLVGQHAHQMLLEKRHHLKLIDKFLDEDGMELKKELEQITAKYWQIIRELEEIEKIKTDAKEKRELYEFQLEEIREVSLVEGEDEQLEEEYKRLFNAGKIKENLTKAVLLLKENEQNALSMISQSKNSIEYISKYSREYEEILEKLENCYYELQEGVYAIENAASDIESDEGRLNKIVDRLDKINTLKKKHGSTISEVIEYGNRIEEKLSVIDSNSIEESRITKEKTEILGKFYEKSKKLSQKRREIAKEIEYRLIEHLRELNMSGVRFQTCFEEKEDISKDGLDSVEFMISTNIGEELKPLSKIVSGGEVSRIMLALKAIFSQVDKIPILIFDEIDTGIGGETVRKVAEKLKKISENVQVLCITHSPQIAAKGSEQFYIEKTVENGKTETKVEKLSDEGRVKEIARMLAGENISEAVINHAKELLKEGL